MSDLLLSATRVGVHSPESLQGGAARVQRVDELDGERLDVGSGGLVGIDEVVNLGQGAASLRLQGVDDPQHVGDILALLNDGSRGRDGSE